jgi:hypothetical protein
VKSFGGHADDGERVSVHLQRPADDGGIAVEAALPELVAEHGERRRAGLIAVRRREQPADLWMRAEDVEVVGRHHVAEDPLGAVGAAEAHRLGAQLVGVDVSEHGVARPDVEVVRVGAVVEAAAVLAAADIDEPSGLDDADRCLEQQRVGDREDRGVGADADRQRGGRRQREQRVAAQQPRGVADVLQPGIEHGRYYAPSHDRFTGRRAFQPSVSGSGSPYAHY